MSEQMNRGRSIGRDLLEEQGQSALSSRFSNREQNRSGTKNAVPNKGKRRRKKIIQLVTWYTLVPLILVGTLFIGLGIGYTQIGKEPLEEIFNMQTWRHMMDLIFASGG